MSNAVSQNFDLVGVWKSSSYEKPDSYQRDGLAPLNVGQEITAQKYQLLCKIGHGGSCTVWLAWNGLRYAAIKVAKAYESTGLAFESELKVLRLLTETTPKRWEASELLSIPDDIYKHESPNGQHNAFILPVMGPSLEDAVSSNLARHQLPSSMYYDNNRTTFSKQFTKSCLKDMILALSYLHSHSIVHADLRLDQMLIELSTANIRHPYGLQDTITLTPKAGNEQPGDSYPSQIYANQCLTDGIRDIPRTKLGDFGGAFIETDDNSKMHLNCNLEYAAPELMYLRQFSRDHPEYAKLCPKTLTSKLDVWSFGMAIHQLLTHKPIYSYIPEDLTLDYDENTKRIMLLLVKRLEVLDGPSEAKNLKYWYTVMFDEHRNMKESGTCYKSFTDLTPLSESMLRDLPGWMTWEDRKQMIRIVKWCLTYDPAKRPSIKDLTGDQWLSHFITGDRVLPYSHS